ncbi:MAG: voltage-gated potassium channel, partial [Kiritimatiellia bacterium]
MNKNTIHEIIFEADTPIGRAFDIALIVCIISSVVVVLLDSIADVRAAIGPQLHVLEWVFTILFTIEYLLRLSCVGRPSA